MPLYNFQERFAPKVESGEKLHTIRKRRKRPTKTGETLYLYTGCRTPKAHKLRPDNPKCTDVLPIQIGWNWVVIDGERLDESEIGPFAVSDGFADEADFFAFWRDFHGLTKNSVLDDFDLIKWEPKK